MIDLPGLTKVNVGDQPEDIEKLVIPFKEIFLCRENNPTNFNPLKLLCLSAFVQAGLDQLYNMFGYLSL